MEEEIRKQMLGIKENTPPASPPREKQPVFTTKSIEQKREELEILRLDKEIERLSKPDINETSYFKDMILQQQNNFNEQMRLREENFKQYLESNKQMNDLKIEFEKLKLGNGLPEEDNTLQYLEMLKPFIPVIAQNMQKKTATALKTPSPVEVKGGIEEKPKMELKTAEQIEDYKKKIKSGEITEEMAYKDFEKEMGKTKAKILKSTFKKEFDKIKLGN